MLIDKKGASHCPTAWSLSKFVNRNFRVSVCFPHTCGMHSRFIGFKKLVGFANESKEFGLWWIAKRARIVLDSGCQKRSFTINHGLPCEVIITFYVK